jgi:stearoyl-CoA desaturase (delta-9 desaturase)
MEKTRLTDIVKNTFMLTNLWGSIVPMQLVGIYAIYSILTGVAPSWWWAGLITGYVLLAMVGIAAGYHRLFSHKGFEVNTVTKRIILWLAMLAGQGSPIYWIGIHRGYHHRYADTDKDAHSPSHGFWHSYILWMFKMRKISIRSVVDLLKDPDMIFAHRHYQMIFWISHLTVALINFDVWLYFMGFPAFITLHCFLAQTSITHIKWAGYRNYNVKDNSVNVPWLWPLVLGEAWHNNHHGEGRNPNYRRRWWELDPTYWIIKLISRRRQQT